MIIRDFLNWVDTAPEGPRAEAAGALARAWLYSELDDESRRAASAALTYLLDDPCEDVRMALAQSLARSDAAPRHIIHSLAQDTVEIASVILASSPLLTEPELIEFLIHPDEQLHTVIAKRCDLAAPVSAAIAEIGSESVCRSLVLNSDARIVPSTLVKLAERFPTDKIIREALLKRPDLPIHVRHALLLAHARSLGDEALAAGASHTATPEELLSDASDRFALRLLQDASEEQMIGLAMSLRDRGMLNTRLLLRSVSCGRFRFFAVALSLLSGVPGSRVSRALLAARPAALRAVLRKAGLPMRTHQAFLLAIDMAREGGADLSKDLSLDQARSLIEQLLGELQDEALGDDGDILAFLRRFAVEVARLEARAYLQQSTQRSLTAA